jgi:endonuclease YncB( thermonuclease family)
VRRLIPILVLAIAACSPQAATDATGGGDSTRGTAPQGREGRIDTVLDGDSVRIVLDGVSTEIRLLGINAPERNECWADESRNALTAATANRSLTVVGDDIDQYGRTLAYVYDGATNVNLAQVVEGHALIVASDHDLLPEFLAAEDDAVRLERGLWAWGSCGERLEHEVSIWVIEPDAPGRDDTNPNGEFVAITNGGEPIDLGGWMLRDESSVHRYTFPSGTVLGTGAIASVRSGCGTDEPPELLYWCADGPVWTNSGDTALLLEPSGAIADRERYFGD